MYTLEPLSPEMFQLKKLVQMETIALEDAKSMQPDIKDDKLKTLMESHIKNCESRIREIQIASGEAGEIGTGSVSGEVH